MANFSAEALKIWVSGGPLNGGSPVESVVSRPMGGCPGCPAVGGCGGGSCPLKSGMDSRVINFKPEEFSVLVRARTVVEARGSLPVSSIRETVRPVSSGKYCSECRTTNCSHKIKAKAA